MSFFGFDTALPEDDPVGGAGGNAGVEAAYDALNDDTFGLGTGTQGGSDFGGMGNVLSSALDSVLDGGDAYGSDDFFAADVLRLTEDDVDRPIGSGGGSGMGGSSGTAPIDLGASDLITPGMLLKTPTTTIHGMPTASIWGAPPAAAAAPPVSAPAAASTSQPTSSAQPSMSLAELEAKLRASAAPVPAPLGPPAASRPPPGIVAPPQRTQQATTAATTQQAQEEQSTRPPEERASAWKKPDEASGGDGEQAAVDSQAKPTPILSQLKQQQGEHALMQRKMAEGQRFEAEMKRLGAEMDASKQALVNHQRSLHNVRMQMAQLPPTTDPAKVQELRHAEHTHGSAATEQNRRLLSLEQMCVAAQRRFERLNLDLAVEAGMAEEHRKALLESIRVKNDLLNQKRNGLAQLTNLLQTHQGMLQHHMHAQPPNPPEIHKLQQTLAMLSHQHMGSQKHCQVLSDEIKYQESLLDLLPLSPEEEESAQFNNLMSRSEQKWLVKIQAKQMHSDNPYVDDFYAHALVRKRTAMMRAAAVAHTGGNMPRLPPTPHGPMPMGKHRREHLEQARAEKEPYKPVQFDKTLGSIKGTSIRAPKALIEIPSVPADVQGSDDGDKSRELKERSRRRRALILIEKAFRLLLQAEDRGVKLEQADMSSRARQQIMAERDAFLDLALELFQIAPADKEWSAEDDQQFWRLTAVEKGRKLFARLLTQITDPKQLESMLLILVRNMGIMVQSRASQQEHREFLQSILALYPGAVAQAVAKVDLGVLVSCFRTTNQVYDAMQKDGGKWDIFHKFCAVLLYTLCRRADAILSTGTAPIEQQQEWSFHVEAIVTKTATDLAAKIAELKTNGLYLWEFANILASHSSPAGKATLRTALADVAAAGPPHVSIDMFHKITAPPPEPAAAPPAAESAAEPKKE
eukprot:m.172403 g.172403  ORF g.172403 m.172403 type:complete len:916 (-) comp13531_c0_seq1:214-2961(-)